MQATQCTLHNLQTKTEPAFLEQTTATTWAPGREQLIPSDLPELQQDCKRTSTPPPAKYFPCDFNIQPVVGKKRQQIS